METIRLGARLRAARKAAGFKTSKAFIKKNKVPASTYSQHESGARIPDDESLKFYSKIFLVDFQWLKEGKGLPYTKVTTSSDKYVLEDELLDLNQFKHSFIDQNLLTSILNEIISIYAPIISNQTIKKITLDTIKIYKSISSSDLSINNQSKILKKIIRDCKNNNQ